MFVVYVWFNNINGKIYIGKTKNLQQRTYEHKKDTQAGSIYPIHKAIRKYSINNFTIEKLFESSNEDVTYEYERVLIKLFDSRNRDIGYNISEGGRGNKGFVVTERCKEKYRKLYSGENSTRSKLSNSDAIQILKLYSKGGITIKNLSYKFNVGRSTIQRLLNRESFKNININKPDILNIGNKNRSNNISKGESNNMAKLSIENVLNIREEHDGGNISNAALGRKYNVSRTLIGYIVKRKIWKHI